MSFMQEAVRQWSCDIGSDRPTEQWLLSDYDTWERNPHYIGPDQGHPEFDEPACSVFLTFKEASTQAKCLAKYLSACVSVEKYEGRCWVVRH